MTSRLTDERIAEIEKLATALLPRGDRLVFFEVADIVRELRDACKDLLAEVKALKAEKAQAEAERDALAAELKENWPFLSGVMYAAAEMVTNGMDTTIPLDILMASGHWDEFEAHCNSYDVERFRQAVREKCVNRLRLGQRTQQQTEKQGEQE